ncbi:hypothetical protein GQX73_g9785 [Xylaria multiplex]|uniref:Protein kinase domain-containing protein n=1 Tax=Xylaria multiplex TaxID=323545 RepID=A0A7C8IHG1_9PEZI|nr:hypothetical protein GQX73_g9785 [Xylaria multiplex]
MAPLLHISQTLKGRNSTYTLVKELHRAVDEAAVYLARNQSNELCIRYQSKSSFIRPLIDEIQQAADPPSIILSHLDSKLLTESKNKRLTRLEIKQVAKCILEALRILHKDGLVHTDVKLDNVLVNYGQGDQRFSKIQLSDFGGAVSQDSSFAKEGHTIGATFTRSPEAMLQLSWGTSTDVWSFRNTILSLVHGGGYHHLDPGWEGFKPEDQDYEITVLKRMYNSFGPFPPSIAEITHPDAFEVIYFLTQQGPPQKPLRRWSTKELPPADNEFIRRILKLDPWDRPTVEDILQDEWFTEESEDTREPIPVEPKMN